MSKLVEIYGLDQMEIKAGFYRLANILDLTIAALSNEIYTASSGI